MLVGLVNSGIMKLSQAIGVIMGSNIGTTITAWILSLSGIQSTNFFVRLLKPESFSPIMALVGVVYNIQLLKLEGENGVSAYGALNYVCMIFLAIFIGFSIGTAPIIGYNFGAKNHNELKNVLKKSITIIIIASISMFVVSELLSYPLSYVFAGYDDYLLKLTTRAFIIYSFF